MGRRAVGTVWKDKGKWRVQLTLSKKRWSMLVPERKDGKPVTRAYAEDFRDRLLSRYETGDWDPWVKTASVKHQTVREFLTAWIERQGYTTVHDDRRRINRYIVPSAFGRMPLREVRPRHIADFLEWLAGRPSRRGGKLAQRSVRNVYSVIQRAFARATVDEVFEVSPCEAVAKAGLLPSMEDKEPGARVTWKYTQAEAEALISDPRIPQSRRAFYAILLMTGCRFGEAAALQWGDYDPTTSPLGRLTISRSIQAETRVIKGTKTGAIKLAPVVPYLAQLLADWKASRRNSPEPLDWIVPNKRGVPRAPSACHQALARDCRRIGIPVRGMIQHGLRHTFVTLARGDGARGEILRWVTHAPPKAMLDQYYSPEWETLCVEVSKLRLGIALQNAREPGSENEIVAESTELNAGDPNGI